MNSDNRVTVVNTEVLNGYVVHTVRMNLLGIEIFHNGYVELDRDHPLYDVDYSEIAIQAHGGLTYSSNRLADVVEYEDNIWVIGFDTAHYDDNDITQSEEAVHSYLQDLTKRLQEEDYEIYTDR